jgi:hypothetical protein
MMTRVMGPFGLAIACGLAMGFAIKEEEWPALPAFAVITTIALILFSKALK